ncbi:MAG: hypothetical protein N2485_00260 [bacterium]|nr:hypothetical protein [bacterium]
MKKLIKKQKKQIIIKIFIFIIILNLFFIKIKANNYLENIYRKINITYTFESFYTGSIENKLFISKNLFTDNPILFTTNNFNYSQGVYIDSIDNNYILFSNIFDFSNNYSVLVNYFEDKRDKIDITDSFYFKSFYSYFLIDVISFYNELEKEFGLIGIINYFFNTDLFLGIFDKEDIKNSIIFGTSSLDYPFYFAKYSDPNFNGFIVLSIIDKNNYRDFLDTKLNFDFKMYNSNSILVTFIDDNLKISKYFVLRFPNKITDLSIIKNSIDNVLLKVDFIDNISGYYITSIFVNINYKNTSLANSNNIFNNFYIDNSLIDFKSYKLTLNKTKIDLYFFKKQLNF